MFTKSILVLAVAALSVATPVRRQGGACTAKPPPATGDAATVAVLPTADNGDHELASPPSNVTLAAIGLGHGIQNYTCVAADDGTLSAKSLGALAVLYDITDLYPGVGPNSLPSMDAFDQLPVPVLEMLPIPLNLDTADASNISVPATTEPFIDPPTGIQMKNQNYPFLGRHFFNADGVPTFDLKQQKGLLGVMKKDDATPAPSSAYAGPMGTGAVAWLLLSDNGSSDGVAEVYRVNTAGGNAEPCTSEGQAGSVSYSAQYWFYVPATA